MTKTTSLSCVMAAVLHLTFGIAMAADNTETEQAKPAVTTNPENQSKPKEVIADTPPSQDNAAKPKEEPAKTQEPECN